MTGAEDIADPLAPLVVEFDVAAPPERAFATWVEKAGLWWPAGHTISKRPEAVVFEPRPGGRIYERDRHGVEHDWGEVLHCQPPDRIEYLWHLFFRRAEATTVAVTFTPTPAGTRVRLEQSGWDALGEEGPTRRERTSAGWAAVTQPYRELIAET